MSVATNILKGKCKRKAELVELAFNAHSMELAKVSEQESENENLIMAELLATDEGVLPDPASILKSNCSRNLTIFPEFTSPDICNYLLGKTDEYSEETLKSLKALRVINFSKMDMFWTRSSWRRTVLPVPGCKSASDHGLLKSHQH